MTDDRVVLASDVQAKIEAGELARFDDCTIVGDLNLSALKIEQPVHFNRTIFKNSANFKSTIFNGTAYFINSDFNGTANFWDSVFSGIAHFQYSNFKGDANFGGSVFNGVNFMKSVFKGDARFMNSDFKSDAYFVNSVFNGAAEFQYSNFKGYASFYKSVIQGYTGFRESIFNGTVDFGESDFNDDAYFVNSVFNGAANFGESNFKGSADFEESNFKGYASFWHSDFKGDANFWHSDFKGDANFVNSVFNGLAYFSESVFNGTVLFILGDFSKVANFNDVVFNESSSFDSSQFKGDGLFENTIFKGKLSLAKARYNRLFIRWYNIKDVLLYDDAAYMSLMKNFKDLGYFEDHDNCYYQYKEMHRTRTWNIPGETFLKFIEFLSKWSYGYGVRPMNALLPAIILILFFGIFWRSKGIVQTMDRNDRYDLADDSHHNRGCIALKWVEQILYFLTPFTFSFILFISAGNFFVDPPELPDSMKKPKSWTKRMFDIEKFLGGVFLALFFIALSSTMIRGSVPNFL